MAPPAIVASKLVAASPEAVFAYLEDLANHANLAPRSAEVLLLERRPGRLDQAVVSLRGPWGMRRTASTELVGAEAPRLIAGRARLGRRTTACVTWGIASAAEGSLVSLTASVETAGPIDALILRVGGRRWIARRFAAALDVLAVRLHVEGATERARPEPAAGTLLPPDPALSGEQA